MKTVHAREVSIALLLLCVVVLVLLFAGQAGPYASRSFKALWNLGHLFAFFLWTLLALQTFSRLAALRWPLRLLICVLAALVSGVLIEYLQVPLGRQAEVADVINDVLGSVLAFVVYTGIHRRTAVVPLIAWLFAVCLIIAWHNRTGIIHLYDDMLARQQFPVLLEFSMPVAITRIHGDAVAGLVHDNNETGLKLLHGTDRYSGFAMNYFPRDWRGYSSLQIRIVNPENRALDLTCRIHDIVHSDGDEEYSDRFNRSFRIVPGNNTITIPLDDVAAAPAGRRLDLAQVGGLGCFTVDLPETRELHLYSVQLL